MKRNATPKKMNLKRRNFVKMGSSLTPPFWMAIFAGFSLLVAVVYAFFAWLTLKAVAKQASHASEQVGKMGATLEAMDREQDILRDQLTVMRDTLKHNREVFNEAKIQALRDSIDTLKQLHVMDKQALISEAQMNFAVEAAKITEGQLEAMKDQAKTMDRSLVFGTRAYLGIQSVNLDIASRRIFLHVENAGKVPAKDVMVVTEIKAEVPAAKCRSLCSNPPQTQVWAEKGNERRIQIPFVNRLGRTKAFPGIASANND